MRAKYKVFDDARLSAAAIEGSVCLGRGDQAHGRDALQRADKAFQDSEGMLAAPARLEYAKALSRAGEGERAKGILQGLAKDCQHDRGMLLRIDRVMDEPVSNAGKKQIIELNRRGIAWFKENDYKRAHDAFARARGRFPRNVELNLNLLQALVKLIESSMDADEREQWLEEADDCLRLMGQVPPDHPKHVSVERIRQDLRQLR